MTDVKRRVRAIQPQVHPIEWAARIHDAAEQLIGRVINGVGIGVISANHDSLRKPPVQVDGACVVDAATERFKRRQGAELGMNERVEVLEVGEP